MHIFTYFDPQMVHNGRRKHVERGFGVLPGVQFDHVESLLGLDHLLKKQQNPTMIFGFSDRTQEDWTTVFPFAPYVKNSVLISSSLDKEYYIREFLAQTGRPLEVIDTLNYYPQLEGLIRRLDESNVPEIGLHKEVRMR